MEPSLNIGVDVAKAYIVVACAQGSFAGKQIPNRSSELRAWLASLPTGTRIGVESTGEYHELLAQLACARGLTVFVLNARDLHHYARAVGLRGKTDRVDAQLIARYLAAEHARLRPWAPPTAEQRQIDRLLKRRAQIARARAALSQSLKGEKALASELAALKRQFEAVLDKLDAKLAKLVAASPARQSTCTQLSSIYGFGPLLGSYLGALFERIHFSNAKAFVAFTGYDPRPNDSGNKTGRRRLSKRGPAELRRLLFLAAMNWSKTEHGRALYEHYRQRGLTTTASLVVLARKLARIAFALHKHGTTFDTARLVHA
jgi:transposase